MITKKKDYVGILQDGQNAATQNAVFYLRIKGQALHVQLILILSELIIQA